MVARRSELAKRSKFLMPERGNLRLPSEFEKFQWSELDLRPFSASRALFVHFGAAKMDTQPGRKPSNGYILQSDGAARNVHA